jgi:hypothetical protein
MSFPSGRYGWRSLMALNVKMQSPRIGPNKKGTALALPGSRDWGRKEKEVRSHLLRIREPMVYWEESRIFWARQPNESIATDRKGIRGYVLRNIPPRY